LLFSGDDVAIDFQYAAAFAKAGAIVRIVKSDRVLARSERIRSLPVVSSLINLIESRHG
jgi:hypothetical protein